MDDKDPLEFLQADPAELLNLSEPPVNPTLVPIVEAVNPYSYFITIRNISSESLQTKVLEYLEKVKSELPWDEIVNSLRDGRVHLPRLNEYLVIYLMQDLLKLPVQITVGDTRGSDIQNISGALETLEAVSAPQVVLPKNAQEVLLTTAENLDNHMILQHLGIVTATEVITRIATSPSLHWHLERSLQSGAPQSNKADIEVNRVFQSLFYDLQIEALSRGGNAVTGIKVNTFIEKEAYISEMDQLRIIVSGTALLID